MQTSSGKIVAYLQNYKACLQAPVPYNLQDMTHIMQITGLLFEQTSKGKLCECRLEQDSDLHAQLLKSFTYESGCLQAFIGLGLSIGKATEKGHSDYGTITGVNHGSDTSPAAASWNIFVALGSVAFAYSFVSLAC